MQKLIMFQFLTILWCFIIPTAVYPDKQFNQIKQPAFKRIYNLKELRIPSAIGLNKLKKIIYYSKRILAKGGKTKFRFFQTITY